MPDSPSPQDFCLLPRPSLSPTPSPMRFAGGVGTLAVISVVGVLMFGLGASVSLFQNGHRFPVLARQAPDDVDWSALNQQRIKQQVEARRQERLRQAAPTDPAPTVIPGAIPIEPEEPVMPADSGAIVVPSEILSDPAPAAETGEVVLPEQIVPAQEDVAPIVSEPLVVAVPQYPSEIGIFFTQTSVKNDKFFLKTLDRLSTLTGSALIFNVKAGTVHFRASAPMAEELNLVRPSYDLPEVLRQARERGVATLGRFVALKDPNLARALPETQIRHPKTGRSVGNVWVDASNPLVLTHNEQILRELVKAGIDEINLDYIRYPTEYAQASIGLTGSEKADRIEAFLKMARRVIDEEGGKTKLGISTYAILGWNFPVNFEPLGQDIARFAPLVDVISPMAYPATFAAGSYYNPQKHPRSRMYYLVYRTLTGYAELLGDQAWKLRPWIQGYGITQKNLKDQIDAVFDSGVCGFTIWNASNEYGTFMKMLGDIERPEHCVQ
ncbi:MAG: putative glycoside hydrolase [Candidatus Peregrinibacteria bacterium]